MASNTQTLKDFMYIETSASPLVRVDNHKILQSIIDPTTGEVYDGIILEGEFASIDVLNNNNRLYDEENYLGFIDLLKKQIHSPKGVYGCYEHPEGYATKGPDISHKILDIWYDADKKKVFGIVMLLNTTKGIEAQQIVKSGGQLAISARGGGSEIKNNDGTISAKLKLLITFDLVYHPGFNTAILNFTKLNESFNPDQQLFENGKISLCIYEPQMEKIGQLYESYIGCKNNNNLNFLQWCVTEKLFESERTEATKTNKVDIKKLETNVNPKKNSLESNLINSAKRQLSESEETKEQDKNDIAKLERNETSQQDDLQDDLQDAVDEQLSQAQKSVFQQQMIKANKRLGGAVYDNSAGFMTEDFDGTR